MGETWTTYRSTIIDHEYKAMLLKNMVKLATRNASDSVSQTLGYGTCLEDS